MTTTITASAPGSLMVSGEHAVVYGHPAIVNAIDRRINVTLQTNPNGKIRIDSALAQYESNIDDLKPEPRLRFVLACLKAYQQPLKKRLQKKGLTLTIESDIDTTLGFGSSAAVTVATLGALARYHQQVILSSAIHQKALQIIRQHQGHGSGADLAASLWGGMLAYRHAQQAHVQQLPLPPALMSVSYCGYKTPTAQVLSMIAERMQKNPDSYQQLYEKMGTSTETTIAAAKRQDWAIFYAELNDYTAHMQTLGVCDATLKAMLQAARAHRDTFSSKISGSGLGDCIVTFSQTLPPQHRPISIAQQGLTWHA